MMHTASALDLTTDFPRSPREKLGDYIIAARTLDKCRALIAGTNGEYHYDCPLDNVFFDFTGITAEGFKEFVATGASDEEVASWIAANSKQTERRAIIQWNNEYRGKRLLEMPIELQEFLEDYIPQYVGSNRVIFWFDVYDIEEKRM